ncbi:MAG: DUF1289 domain-containing protein [Gammaproteobacteria bacterium]|jgi:uncharacterized protein
MASIPQKQIASPCIRNCCLDDDDICLGCFRSIDEITGWSSAGVNGQLEIIKRCKERNKAKSN